MKIDLTEELTSAIADRTWLIKSEARAIISVIKDHLNTNHPDLNSEFYHVIEAHSANSEELSGSNLN